MALEPIKFKLSDFAGNPGLELRPRVVFRPNGLAAGGDKLFYSAPVVVDQFAPDGSATAHLEGTDALWLITGADAWYDVTVERRVATYTTVDGVQATADYAPWDYPGWILKVPPGGGDLAALVRAPTNPAQVWVGPGKRPWSDHDEPVQTLLPSTYTGWWRSNTVPDMGLRTYFEWE